MAFGDGEQTGVDLGGEAGPAHAQHQGVGQAFPPGTRQEVIDSADLSGHGGGAVDPSKGVDDPFRVRLPEGVVPADDAACDPLAAEPVTGGGHPSGQGTECRQVQGYGHRRCSQGRASLFLIRRRTGLSSSVPTSKTRRRRNDDGPSAGMAAGLRRIRTDRAARHRSQDQGRGSSSAEGAPYLHGHDHALGPGLHLGHRRRPGGGDQRRRGRGGGLRRGTGGRGESHPHPPLGPRSRRQPERRLVLRQVHRHGQLGGRRARSPSLPRSSMATPSSSTMSSAVPSPIPPSTARTPPCRAGTPVRRWPASTCPGTCESSPR